jgi:sugar-specific transcriptional regulator TrmB
MKAPNTTPNNANTSLKPEWIRVPEAVRVSGISRSQIYELIKSQEIRSFALKERGAMKGIRLISYDSLMQYIEQMYEAANALLETGVAND